MRNILITGGGLNNKGAQAMTFICVDELSKRFPNHNIILLSDSDYKLPNGEKEKYKFSFSPEGDIKCAFYKLGGIYKLIALFRKHNKNKQKEMDILYGKADILVDVSGYALGSIWGFKECLLFLTRFVYTKAYGIDAFVMPQSFGPFNFDKKKSCIINWLIKKFLGSANIVFAREQDGYEGLTQKYGLKNVELSDDMVIKSKKIDSSRIFKKYENIEIKVKKNSVGIIPNKQNFYYCDNDELYSTYKKLIDFLIEKKKNIYLIYHAKQDLVFCEKIKSYFQDNEKVIIINEELNCIQFSDFITQFDFIVASRFHSVVQAYKNCIPCLVLGWANKYKNLMSIFDQEQYMFDVREQIDNNKVLFLLSQMNDGYKEESKKIESRLVPLQQDSLFDKISNNIKEGK